ncbi:uncharacterized protein LOC109862798 [Pseudomyrmex gracilis]|uniref:uncharacterized protein LOC109862798 n=1 Tax=Pseudomyrmex gracilis TaxID=219809 RepID=UPI000995C563|nr:uncharacterized protein LOC109862798 [Pseudomyrmex gracilis]
MILGLDKVTFKEDFRKDFVLEFGGGSGVKVVFLRRSSSAGGAALVRCPVEAAAKAVKAGKLPVGWVVARVRALRPRLLQCYRCFQPGHCRALCSSQVNRSNLCYRCRRPEHRAASCNEKEGCPLCEEAGRESSHQMGVARVLVIGRGAAMPLLNPQ